MTALTQDLTLTGEIVTVDGPLLVGSAYHLQDEIVVVGGSVIENYTDVTTGNRWRVRRGQDHTTAATHSSGTALTLAREFETGGGAGAGGVTVDNTVDAPFSAETLISAGATESAPGEATLQQQQLIAQTGDDSASVTVTANGVSAPEARTEIVDGAATGNLYVKAGAVSQWDTTDVAGDSAFAKLSPGVAELQGTESAVTHSLKVHGGAGLLLDDELFTRAAFVANGSTVDQLRDALIASGLMEAS